MTLAENPLRVMLLGERTIIGVPAW